MNRDRAFIRKSSVISMGIAIALSKTKSREYYEAITDNEYEASLLKFNEEQAYRELSQLGVGNG